MGELATVAIGFSAGACLTFVGLLVERLLRLKEERISRLERNDDINGKALNHAEKAISAINDAMDDHERKLRAFDHDIELLSKRVGTERHK